MICLIVEIMLSFFLNGNHALSVIKFTAHMTKLVEVAQFLMGQSGTARVRHPRVPPYSLYSSLIFQLGSVVDPKKKKKKKTK